MAKRVINNVRLGLFVIAGMAALIMFLYLIGRNQNLFGKTFMLKVRFENVHGLMPGNNVRYAGINAGTVKSVEMLNDTTIEVSMLIRHKMKDYIHRNAVITIGTDGLMGNKLLNIQAAKYSAPVVQEGDILYSNGSVDTDEMMKVLNTTNNDIAAIAKDLKVSVQRLNASKAFWGVLSDESLPSNLKISLDKIRNTSDNLNNMAIGLNNIVGDVKGGKGSVGMLLNDTSIAYDLKDALKQIKGIGSNADTLSAQMNTLLSTINNEVNNGKGTVTALLKDPEMVMYLQSSLKNIEKGTNSFNENMEAIKHSFLLRGYFRKLEQQKQQPAAVPGSH
jgi:phospholipid/cholesterol/gamma-HCH transport system substrate-binding protein